MTSNYLQLTIPRLIITMLIILSVKTFVKCTNLENEMYSFENKISNNPVRIQRDLSDVWSKVKKTVTSMALIIPKTAINLLGGDTLEKEQAECSEKNLQGGREIIMGIQKQIKEIEQAFVEQIYSLQDNSSYGTLRKELRAKLHDIVPGTQFCEDEKTAGYIDQRGSTVQQQVDYCCANHNKCPNVIPPGEIKYGLNNTSLFDTLSCTCDTQFYNCLKSVSTGIAKKIGFSYFNLLSPRCFSQFITMEVCDPAKTPHICRARAGDVSDEGYVFQNNLVF